jgi:hypothetical protein
MTLVRNRSQISDEKQLRNVSAGAAGFDLAAN